MTDLPGKPRVVPVTSPETAGDIGRRQPDESLGAATREADESKIGNSEELSLLRMEYERMAAEIRMYVEQYSPKLTIFGTFIVAAMTFAYGDTKYSLVYPIVPYFLFIVAGVTISQAYIITCLAERVRQIEKRVQQINGGRRVLKWESVMALKLMYPVVLDIPREKGRHFKAPNPIFGSVILMMLGIIPIVGYCLVKTWRTGVFPEPFLTIYLLLTLSLFLGVLVFSLSWFRLASITGSLKYEDEEPPLGESSMS